MPPIVTLTTDFGTRDSYVAVMKGVLLSACPDLRIVDLTHDIAPQDVFGAAYFLAEAATWYPEGTIHCAVIDPGVGTTRLPIVVRARNYFFVGPDNGLLTFISKKISIDEARSITNPRFMLPEISATFHGRDIFAPTAACLARGAPMEEAGDRLTALTMLEIPCAKVDENGNLCGVVVHVDRFGNAITNIHRSQVPERKDVTVRIGSESVYGIHETYGDVDPGRSVALFGSADYLEIAIHRGNAADKFGAHRGTRVEIRR
ncbi:MAG: hypothetical protein AMXMBFR4_00330 [Candidatus Hydrogenedentota bacterium]